MGYRTSVEIEDMFGGRTDLDTPLCWEKGHLKQYIEDLQSPWEPKVYVVCSMKMVRTNLGMLIITRACFTLVEQF